MMTEEGIDTFKDDNNLMIDESGKESLESSGGILEHIASETGCADFSSVGERSDSARTEDHVAVASKLIRNASETNMSSRTSAAIVDAADHPGFRTEVVSEVSPADKEDVRTLWSPEKEGDNVVNQISGKVAMGIESEGTGLEIHHFQCVDDAFRFQSKDATISLFDDDNEPIDPRTQPSDVLESPNSLRNRNDPKEYVAEESKAGNQTKGNRHDVSYSGKGPGNEWASPMEARSKAGTEESSQFSMDDAIIHPPSQGSLHPESLDDVSNLRADKDKYPHPSYGYTTIWGRKKELTLSQGQLQNLLENKEETVDQGSGNASVPNQVNIESTLDAGANETIVFDQLSDTTKAPKSVNAEFVEGLDDIDKFLEEVEPPDELDVGAAGSSIQEVLVGQGAQILTKHVTIVLIRIQKSLQASRLKKFLASRRTEAGQLKLVTMDDLDRVWEGVRSSFRNIFRNVQCFWDDLFDDDEDSAPFEVEETTKLHSIRQVLLNQ